MNRLLSLSLLILFIAAAFSYSVELRKDSFGKFAVHEDGGGDNTNWVNLSYYSLNFAKNWYYRGAGRMNFALQMNPPSIERGRWSSVYASFTPAFLFPYHVFSKLSGIPPNPKTLMGASLFFHLASVLVLALFLYFLAVPSLGTWTSALMASAVGALGFFSPPSLFYFQTAYWPDLVGLAPFFFAIGAECARAAASSQRTKAFWATAVHITLYFGVLIDWLNLFLALIIFAHRFWKEAESRRGEEIYLFWRGVAAALLIFILHSYRSHANIWAKFRERGGFFASDGIGWDVFFTNFFGNKLAGNMGEAGLVLVILSFIFAIALLFFYRKKHLPPLALFSVLCVFSALLHAFIFKQHYYHHSYNTLKFAFLVAAVPFFCFPAIVLSSPFFAKSLQKIVLLLCFIAGASAYLEKGLKIFQAKPRWENTALSEQYNAVSHFLARHTKYSDVIFSDTFAIDTFGADATKTEFSAISFKYVYQTKTLEEVRKRYDGFVKASLPIPYLQAYFWFLSEGEPPKHWQEALSGGQRISDGRFVLTQIPETSVLSQSL